MSCDPLFLPAPMRGVPKYNACPEVASKSGAGRNFIDVATAFQKAIEESQIAFCLFKNDRENRRLFFRYIRSLRRCDRLQRALRNA